MWMDRSTTVSGGGKPMMDMINLVNECAPQVHPTTMHAILGVESGHNPYAIGVVKGRLARQPRNKSEAVATARALAAAGWNFSMGPAQVNRYNLDAYGLTYETAFEPCKNIRAGAQILKSCYDRAHKVMSNDHLALRAAISCYYSGNFTTGFKADFKGQPPYVQKVLAHAGDTVPAIPVVANKSAGNTAVAASLSLAEPAADSRAPVSRSPGQERRNHVPEQLDGFRALNDESENTYSGFSTPPRDNE